MKSSKKQLQGGLRRVLIGTDFSPGARMALRRAQHLTYAQNAEVQLIHVLPKKAHVPETASFEAHLHERMQREISTLARALTRLGRDDVRVQGDFRRGTPAAVLASAGARHHAELLVIGRLGATGLRQFLLGSTAEQVANAFRRDVLIVGRRATRAYAHPLVALPPEPDAHHVLEAAVRAVPGARLEVITAAHVPMETSLWAGWSSTREILAVKSAVKKQAHALAGEQVDRLSARGVRLKLTIVEGEPRQVLLTEATRRRADLLVIGKRDKGGRTRLRIGSVAAQVLRSAQCDVLLASAATEPGDTEPS